MDAKLNLSVDSTENQRWHSSNKTNNSNPEVRETNKTNNSNLEVHETVLVEASAFA